MGIRDILRKVKEKAQEYRATEKAEKIANAATYGVAVHTSNKIDDTVNKLRTAYHDRGEERVQERFLKEETQNALYRERLTQIPRIVKEQVHAETEELIKGYRETAQRGRSGQRTGVSGFLFNAPTSNPFSSDIPREVQHRMPKKGKHKGKRGKRGEYDEVKHRESQSPRSNQYGGMNISGSGLFSDNPFREVHDRPRSPHHKKHKKSKDIVIKVR